MPGAGPPRALGDGPLYQAFLQGESRRGEHPAAGDYTRAAARESGQPVGTAAGDPRRRRQQ